VHENLISLEIWNSHCYSLVTVYMVRLQMAVINGSINSEGHCLVLGINHRSLSKGCIEAVDFLVGPRQEEV